MKKNIKIVREKITMTPELAQYYLNRNFHNRPLNEENVLKLMSIITEGKWVFNRRPLIEISSKDTLLNGQHRLTAILRCQKSVEVIISRRIVIEEENQGIL